MEFYSVPSIDQAINIGHSTNLLTSETYNVVIDEMQEEALKAKLKLLKRSLESRDLVPRHVWKNKKGKRSTWHGFLQKFQKNEENEYEEEEENQENEEKISVPFRNHYKVENLLNADQKACSSLASEEYLHRYLLANDDVSNHIVSLLLIEMRNVQEKDEIKP